MHGQFAPQLSHQPAGSNNLVVTGPLVADTNADLTTAVTIKAEIWVTGGRPVACSTNGGGILPSYGAGTMWTMNASTTVQGPVNARAMAFDKNGNVVAAWSQPALAVNAPINVLP